MDTKRLELSTLDGRATMTWMGQPFPLNCVRCRLDLTFLRRGEDQPLPIEAGKAPDRGGVMFCSVDVPIRDSRLT